MSRPGLKYGIRTWRSLPFRIICQPPVLVVLHSWNKASHHFTKETQGWRLFEQRRVSETERIYNQVHWEHLIPYFKSSLKADKFTSLLRAPSIAHNSLPQIPMTNGTQASLRLLVYSFKDTQRVKVPSQRTEANLNTIDLNQTLHCQAKYGGWKDGSHIQTLHAFQKRTFTTSQG